MVVVGGGFGGLLATVLVRRRTSTSRSSSARTTTFFQPLLYQVATGILSEGQIAPPLGESCASTRNVNVKLAEVTGFDLENRTVIAVRPLGTALTLPYDSLIVASGSTASYFGRDGLAEHSIPMKTIDDALNLRRRIFAAFELAETAPTEGRAPRVAHLRRRRWRADGLRDRGADRRARTPDAREGLSCDRPGERRGAARRSPRAGSRRIR